MAIYHLTVKVKSMAKGGPIVGGAAYRSGQRLMDERAGVIHDYRRKGGVVFTEILLPPNAPSAYMDRSTLWNAVQRVERRSDARFAREIEVALPREMTRQEQIDCVSGFIQENLLSKGMIVDWALHDKGDGNPHAHILFTCRSLTEDGEWDFKTRSVFANSMDENGRPIFDPAKPAYNPMDKEKTALYRIPLLDATGEQKVRKRKGKGEEKLWARINLPVNDWDARDNVEAWRESWARHCNQYLAKDNQIDHRSYLRQGIDFEPTIHEGVTARQIARIGHDSDRVNTNMAINRRNRIRSEISKLANEIVNGMLEIGRRIYVRIKQYRTYNNQIIQPEGALEHFAERGGVDGHSRRATGHNGYLEGEERQLDYTIAKTEGNGGCAIRGDRKAEKTNQITGEDNTCLENQITQMLLTRTEHEERMQTIRTKRKKFESNDILAEYNGVESNSNGSAKMPVEFKTSLEEIEAFIVSLDAKIRASTLSVKDSRVSAKKGEIERAQRDFDGNQYNEIDER